MFIKTTRTRNHEYIKLVESYWENGRSHHRVLFNFGRADLIRQDESFVRAVKRLCEITGIPVEDSADKKANAPFEIDDEATLYNYGYIAYQKLWKTLGIDDALKGLQNGDSKASYSISKTVFLMAVQHLLEPRSKLSTYTRQARYFNLDGISLQHMYRTLTKLSGWKEDIEHELFKHNYVRAKQKVDVVFYDVTTIGFESVKADGFREFGFSKECRFNEVQVVMGMIIDINGLPVGYELFPGNTFDGKTLTGALENIRRRFGIKRVIIVADRGINSKENLNLIRNAGYGYIMSSRLKSMSRSQQADVLSSEGFNAVSVTEAGEEFRYKTLPHISDYTDENKEHHAIEENLIISYSSKRAYRDRQDRERLVEKARTMLVHPEKICTPLNRGGRKYIDRTDPKRPESWSLDQGKIDRDAKFDGYYGIQTSERNMTATDVMEAYHTLWKIEESFRIMKSTMEVKPVFHWTPERIRGHFVVCFLAFLMERRLEMLMKDKSDSIVSSPGRIQESLNTMQLAAVTVNGEEMFIRVKSDPLCGKIFRNLKIGMPQVVNRKADLASRFKMDDDIREVQLSLL